MKTIKYSEMEVKEFKRVGIDEPESVREILAGVRRCGDTALREFTLQFDKVVLDSFKVDNRHFEEGLNQLPAEDVRALERSVANLKAFAGRQLEQLRSFEFEIVPGVFTGQRVVPLDRVGVYVPGGRFPLVSSLLMGVVPARAAGVKEIVVCTPPRGGGEVHPAMLAAAAIAGVDEFYTLGGVQAVGAMAYGTETIKPVDKIVGPGNRYVAAAKKIVYGEVGIDFVAGPSEVMIIADGDANPEWIAADLLAQAEHDPLAVPVLVTLSAELGRRVGEVVERQLALLDTREIAVQSLERNGIIVLVETLEDAIDYADSRAPEHLELHVREPEAIVDRFTSYGTLFIGSTAAEVFGDYSSGLNHTLPTSGAARYTGGLSVRDFVKVLTTLRATKEGVSLIGRDAGRLARLEGLSAHAEAADLRLKNR